MSDRLATYRAKRDFARTPEPAAGGEHAGAPLFVIQEHHATALHWDLRLERGGVGVSWAVPKGLPVEHGRNHLAVHTEDHPLSYFSFEGDIPAGEYGGGKVIVWDAGTYECEEWTDEKVKFVLHGERGHGRYVLFHTNGKNWMIRRMDSDPDLEPMPELVRPMLAVARDGPPSGDGWAHEFKWDGVRAIVHVDGGRPRVTSRNDRDVTASYPELRDLAEAMGATRAVLDGEIVALDDNGRPSFETLQQRMHVSDSARVRQLRHRVPVSFLMFDLLWLEGRSLVDLPYADRRELLGSLELAGPSWATPPSFDGDGADLLAAAQAQGLEGIVSKRTDSRYYPGKRSDCWVKVKRFRTQEVVIVGWKPGEGRRAGHIGSLLLAVNGATGLEYAGHVGTGFGESTLVDLMRRLQPLERSDAPLASPAPREHAKAAHWVDPALVAEVAYGEWTREGRLRHPSWRGLRSDKDPSEVVREP